MLVSIVVLIHLLIVLFLVRMFTSGSGPDERAYHEAAFRGEDLLLWIYGICACTWAPFFEEIVFRRFLYRAFRGRWGGTLAAIASSAVFASVHPYSGVGRFSVFLVGLFLCGLYEFRKTLLAPMILHAMINALFMAALILTARELATSPGLGVTFDRTTKKVVIGSVVPGFPAEESGLLPGDVIVEIGEYAIEERVHVNWALANYKIGQTIVVRVEREGEMLEADVVLDRTIAELQEAHAMHVPETSPATTPDSQR